MRDVELSQANLWFMVNCSCATGTHFLSIWINRRMTLSNAIAHVLFFLSQIAKAYIPQTCQLGSSLVKTLWVSISNLDVDRNLEDFRDPQKRTGITCKCRRFVAAMVSTVFIILHNSPRSQHSTFTCLWRATVRFKKPQSNGMSQNKETCQTHQNSVGVLPNVAIANKTLGLKNLDILKLRCSSPMVRPHVLPWVVKNNAHFFKLQEGTNKPITTPWPF